MTITSKSVNCGNSRLNAIACSTPRQAWREHVIGIGVDAEVTGGKHAGKYGNENGERGHQRRVLPAKIDQSGEQALKLHGKPDSQTVFRRRDRCLLKDSPRRYPGTGLECPAASR